MHHVQALSLGKLVTRQRDGHGLLRLDLLAILVLEGDVNGLDALDLAGHEVLHVGFAQTTGTEHELGALGQRALASLDRNHNATRAVLQRGRGIGNLFLFRLTGLLVLGLSGLLGVGLLLVRLLHNSLFRLLLGLALALGLLDHSRGLLCGGRLLNGSRLLCRSLSLGLSLFCLRRNNLFLRRCLGQPLGSIRYRLGRQELNDHAECDKPCQPCVVSVPQPFEELTHRDPLHPLHRPWTSTCTRSSTDLLTIV